MSDDRKLLELAAKAAGIVGTWAVGHHAYGDESFDGLDCGWQFLWNPLVSDGDALRLAVRLRLDILHLADDKVEVVNQHELDEDIRWAWEAYGDDATGAMRRAIVRTAAAIGEQMP